MPSSLGRLHRWPFPVAGGLLVLGDTGAATSATCGVAGPGASGRLTVTAIDSAVEPPAAQAFYDAHCGVYYTKPALRGWAALAVVRGVAGVRDPAPDAGAWSHTDHGHRHLRSERVRDVRYQRAVSPRQLECHLAPAPAAAGPRDDLLPHRRHGNTRLPPRRPGAPSPCRIPDAQNERTWAPAAD
jgi:hypothetical protein